MSDMPEYQVPGLSDAHLSTVYQMAKTGYRNLQKATHNPEDMPSSGVVEVRANLHAIRAVRDAAEPHIRRAVIEELIAEAEEGDIFPLRCGDSDSSDLADWLRCKLEVTP